MRKVNQDNQEPKVKIIDKNTLEETGEIKALKDVVVGDVYQMIKGNQSIREVESIKSIDAENILIKDKIIAFRPGGLVFYD